MYFRSILSGSLAILLVSGAIVQADERAGILDILKPVETTAENGLSRLFGSREKSPADVQVAQAGDPHMTALEEQVRALSGTVEELNFQILQLQEQLRKMQEDNEFRFQELEKKKTDAGGPTDNTVASAPAAPEATGQEAVEETEEAVDVPMEPEVLVDNGTGDPAEVQSTTETEATGNLGAAPKSFGTITFDDNGNVTGGSVTDQDTQSIAGTMESTSPSIVQQSLPDQPAQTQVAALPSTDDPDELYRNSYEFILSGDYGTAETGFRDHISRFPDNQKAADAHFWLGEALLGQKKYRDAAETFLAANKQYPSSKKAPDMLLKLGVSLVGLDQRDVACATFTEIGKRYPTISGALKERVKQEQALAAC